MSDVKTILTLPEIAQRTGASIDRLRRYAPALAAQGLLTKIGASWCAESARAEAVVAAAEAMKGANAK